MRRLTIQCHEEESRIIRIAGIMAEVEETDGYVFAICHQSLQKPANVSCRDAERQQFLSVFLQDIVRNEPCELLVQPAHDDLRVGTVRTAAPPRGQHHVRIQDCSQHGVAGMRLRMLS